MRAAFAPAAAAAVLALTPAAGVAAPLRSAAVRAGISSALASPGGTVSAYVADAAGGRPLYALNADRPRTLASNTKLFTLTGALAEYGPGASLATLAAGTARLTADGVYHGSVYLRGGGDPTFGSRSFARQSYGADADVEALAANLRAAGVRHVTGGVVGDESLFDSLRGGPDSRYGVSTYVGPLSALDFDRGLADPSGSAFQRNPPAFAAARFASALRLAGIRVDGDSRAGPAPAGAVELTEVRSPSFARLARMTMKESDNFFAEMIVKGLPVDALPGGPLRQPTAPPPAPPVPGAASAARPLPPLATIGTTTGGATIGMNIARSFGARAVLADGSGLSHADRASARSIVTLLRRVRSRPFFGALFDALPVAGVDGTLRDRMRSGPAHFRCHAKTGTLTDVSTLSGYCLTRSGHTVAFSVLMNGVSSLAAAHRAQDRVAQAVAAG